jgi:hypothetical protein
MNAAPINEINALFDADFELFGYETHPAQFSARVPAMEYSGY